MKKLKVVALVLCLAVLISVWTPGTLATQTDTAETRTPTCGQTAHVHTDACYTRSETPVCDQPGHVHTDACYEVKTVCTLPEDETHTHVDACNEKTLTCQEPQGHNHTDACYKKLTCNLSEHTHTDSCYPAPATAPTQPACTCGEALKEENGEKLHLDGCPAKPTQPTCICKTNEDGTKTYVEGCPVCEKPAETTDPTTAPTETTEVTTPTCTCGTTDGTHTETCPLFKPTADPITHLETCQEGCTGENCLCPCHELSLFERLMACETLDELFTIVDTTPEDELMALTDEENAEIEAKITALEGEPLPPVVLEECVNESVISEIIYPAVNFDNVAPFGAPVEG
ncbi:MAG: hypothetical protein Q4F17_05095 [Eubacteriales bacterium]|nr:hypothetical protein [Eubacteriales bacterium]